MPRKELTDRESALAEIRQLDLNALRPKIERLSRLAQTIAGTPYAYVTLEEDGYEWTSEFAGLPEGKVPGEQSITSFIIRAGQTVFTPDARIWVRNHPWVAGPPYLRFYCGAPIRLANGVIIGAFCVASPEVKEYDAELGARIEDIAALLADEIERLRAERGRAEARSEAEAAHRLLKSFVQGAPVALAMTDRSLRFVEVSPRWRSEHGLSGRVRGRHVGDVFPAGFAIWGEYWRKALDGQAISADRVLVPGPDGKDRWMRAELTPWRDSAGAIGGVVAMTSDVSDMVASLEQAQHSEQRLKLAIEIADFLVYEMDFKDRTITVVGAEDTFLDRELTFEELAADPLIGVHPEDRAAAQALWEQSARSSRPFRAEHRMNRSDGKEVWAYVAAEVINDADGNPERMLGAMKDITARRQAQHDVMAARDAAEAANRAKSDFLANMSHEIRTPLNGIVGVAQALARSNLTQAQEEMVGLIQMSGATLETILSDVLDFSRIESGRIELRPERFNLASCLRSAATLFRASAQEKGLTFSLEIEPTVEGTCEGDAGRLRQIIFNLLSNAVKFTDTGGVEVRARRIDDGRVAIAVADTGIGFDADFRARIFDRFEQADSSITRVYGGSGLGLAISRSLADAMGGDLDATSEPGRGSTFTLTLPLCPVAGEASEARPAAEPSVAPPLAGPRVLLAEDHAVNRRVIELLLETAEIDLTCVENGRQAVEAAVATTFDLILMDMQMPEMDGLSAIRAIRDHERRNGGPRSCIWALSANALPEHTEASHRAGADGHLAKPVSAPALFRVLADSCATRPEPGRAARSA